MGSAVFQDGSPFPPALPAVVFFFFYNLVETSALNKGRGATRGTQSAVHATTSSAAVVSKENLFVNGTSASISSYELVAPSKMLVRVHVLSFFFSGPEKRQGVHTRVCVPPDRQICQKVSVSS